MGKADDSFITHITELLAPWATIDARHMFGGWGIYRGALMFALVADDVLYLKCGEALKTTAGAHELKLFEYQKPDPAAEGQTKTYTMSYAAVPDALMDESEALCAWAEAAYADAVVARRGVPKKMPMVKRAGQRGR